MKSNFEYSHINPAIITIHTSNTQQTKTRPKSKTLEFATHLRTVAPHRAATHGHGPESGILGSFVNGRGTANDESEKDDEFH